jgi:hypothetical protein
MNSQDRLLRIKYLKNVLKVLNRIPNPDLKLRASVVLELEALRMVRQAHHTKEVYHENSTSH